MPMRGDTISIGHFETYGVVPPGGHGITFEHGQLCARRHERWRWAEGDRTRRKCVPIRGENRMGVGLDQPYSRKQHQHQAQPEIPFHEYSSLFRVCRVRDLLIGDTIAGFCGSFNEHGVTFRCFWCIVAAYW